MMSNTNYLNNEWWVQPSSTHQIQTGVLFKSNELHEETTNKIYLRTKLTREIEYK